MANGTRFLRVISRKRFMVSAFRVVAWLVAVVHLSFFTTDSNDLLPPFVLILAATAYTGLKLVEPSRWYQSSPTGPVLLGIDLAACLVMVELSGELHGPFGLYTLVPVVTSALLLPRRTTLATAAATGVYMTFFVLREPLPEMVDYLAGRLAVYIMALGLTATLPYAINAARERSIQAAAMLGERRRLGREIHDSFCQTVYGLRWQLKMLKHDSVYNQALAERVGRLEVLLEQAEKEARGFVDLLRSFRSERPFLAQLEESLDHLRQDAGIDSRLTAEDGEPVLDDIVKLEALYICEEAFRNVAKHSGAHRVTVYVRSGDGLLRVVISDDGRGLDRAQPAEGHGLASMRERAESIGGRFFLESTPGKGTEIRVVVPKSCPLELPELL